MDDEPIFEVVPVNGDYEEVLEESGVTYVRSRSHPDHWHTTTYLHCTCTLFQFRRRCRHIDAVSEFNRLKAEARKQAAA